MAVCEAGSISRSSGAIFKASSAIARAVAALERGLGVPVFERKPRGMLLNAYGEAVRQRGVRINEEIAEAVEDFSRAGRRQHSLDRSVVSRLLLNGRGLLLLIGIAELRSLSAAGARMGLSQSGASMALTRMEAALGQKLFQRMMQGMIATDAGARLISRGKRIVAELRHMQADIAAISGSLQGHVAIGALPLGRTHLLPAAIAAALRRFPNIRVTTVESPYDVLVAGLRDGEIDFIVGALRPDDAELITEPLFADRLGIIVRSGHRLVGVASSLRDLLDACWILPRPGAPGRGLIDLAFREMALTPPLPAVETGDLAVLRSLLMNSDMLTAISPRQLSHEIAAGDLAQLPVDLPMTERPIGLTSRARAMLSAPALAILDEIRGVAGTMRPGSVLVTSDPPVVRSGQARRNR
jgi:LysR family transcriptional regulator of gallate degradation